MAYTLDNSLIMKISDDVENIIVAHEKYALVEESIDQFTAQLVVLASHATDAAVSLGGIANATFCYIQSDLEIDAKFNGSSDAISGKTFFFKDCDITSISVTNGGTEAANLHILLAE